MTPEQAFLAWLHDDRDTRWMRDAACKGSNPDLFFPTTGEDPRPAQRICATCPVKEQCADYGIGEEMGIYGGLTGKQRERLRRQHEFKRMKPLRRQHGTLAGFYQHAHLGEKACRACRDVYRANKNPEQRPLAELTDSLITCHRCLNGVHGLCRFCSCECRKQQLTMEEDDGEESFPQGA